jgi:hypothetical protein
MRSIKRRLILSIAGGAVFQCLIFLLIAILDSELLLILILPCWAFAFAFAGRDSDNTWIGFIVGWIVMLAINNLFYSTLIYFLLWHREVQEDIRVNDRDSFIKKPDDGSLSIK